MYSHLPHHSKQKCFCCPGHGDQRHCRSCCNATDRAHNSAKSGGGFLDLGLLPDTAVAPFQSCINGIPQQNERTLQVVNKYCMTLQVYALFAFQICSGDLVSRNVLPDSCKGILHNGYEKWILNFLDPHPRIIFAQQRQRNTPVKNKSMFLWIPLHHAYSPEAAGEMALERNKWTFHQQFSPALCFTLETNQWQVTSGPLAAFIQMRKWRRGFPVCLASDRAAAGKELEYIKWEWKWECSLSGSVTESSSRDKGPPQPAAE